MNGFFITGTDTDAGKTVFSALLLAALRRRGVDAVAMKPVQTGCSGARTPDLDYALSMAALEPTPQEYKYMVPYRFTPACSPHLAAELENASEVEITQIIHAARELSSIRACLLVEGAGGILVPLNRRESMRDLMCALRLPIILVARPGLGTINHSLLSIEALRAVGLKIAGIVFVSSTPDGTEWIEKDNIRTIEQFGQVPLLGTIPFCSALQTDSPDFDALPEGLQQQIDEIALNLMRQSQ